MKQFFIFTNRHSLFFLVLGLALLLRIYRIDELTTFGGDQGQDFLVVYDMIVNHKWTLIGIKTSIADFFQGPVYLYMLLPLFWILKLHPLAGPITAVIVSALTLLMLYVTGTAFFTKRTALISCTLFAVSPQFIRYGNTPLYQHFLPLLIVISVYLFLKLMNKKSLFFALLLGISVGIGMELHFLNTTLAFVFLIILIIKKFHMFYIGSYGGGVVIGLSPTLLFEIRHDFLNTRLFLQYIQNHQNLSPSLSTIFHQWIWGAAAFLSGNIAFLGGAVLLFVAVLLIRSSKDDDKNFQYLRLLTIVTLIILLILSFSVTGSQAHYLLPLWVFMVFLIPIGVEKIIANYRWRLFITLLLFCVNLFYAMSSLTINHGYDMPEGWTMKKAIQAGDIIARDARQTTNFNVAFLLDGNTRAYPLRYVLMSKGIKPQPIDSYPVNDHLYAISNNDKRTVIDSNVWEITSLSPFTINKQWDIGD